MLTSKDLWLHTVRYVNDACEALGTKLSDEDLQTVTIRVYENMEFLLRPAEGKTAGKHSDSADEGQK